MSWVSAAVAGLGVVKGLVSSKSSKSQASSEASAATAAAEAQAKAAEKAAQVQWDMYSQNRTDQAPWLSAGQTGLQYYMGSLGLPTAGVTAAITKSNATSATPSTPAVTTFLSGNGMNADAYYNNADYRAAFDEVAAHHKLDPQRGFVLKGMDLGKIEADIKARYTNKVAATKAAADAKAAEEAAAAIAAAQASQPTATVPSTPAQVVENLRLQPGYQFGMNEGTKAVESSAAATGGLFSGKAGKSLTQYAQGYADKEAYTPYMNRLSSLAGVGQTTANSLGSSGQATANNVSSSLLNAGSSRASGLTASTAAKNSGKAASTNAWGDAIDSLGQAGSYWLGNRS